MKISTAGGSSLSTVAVLSRQQEKKRRDRLRRDLHRIADRYELTEPGVAALARAWALEVTV